MTADDGVELDPMLFGPRRHGRVRPAEPGIPPDMLRFGVEFADGAKATNTQGRPRDIDAEPDGPVLNGGGGGGGGSWRQTHWVWPLPPAGSLTFVCEWPAAGVALTHRQTDPQLVLDAAARSQLIFAEEELRHGSGGSYGPSVFIETRGAAAEPPGAGTSPEGERRAPGSKHAQTRPSNPA